MFFLDAFSAPVKVCIRARNGKRVIIHVPIFTIEQVVDWASHIRDEAYASGLEGLTETQRTEARLMYPPIQPDLQDVRRRIHTPEGVYYILRTTMVGAPAYAAVEDDTMTPVSSQEKDPKPLRLPRFKEGDKIKPLNDKEVTDVLKANPLTLLTNIALEVSGAFQLKPQPSQEVTASESPLADSASEEPNRSPETGGTNSSSSMQPTPPSISAA
jgi:hypothetical protein